VETGWDCEGFSEAFVDIIDDKYGYDDNSYIEYAFVISSAL